MKSYSYKDSTDSSYNISITPEQEAIVIQALNDYETARDYIMKQCYFHWRYAYKAYHMSTRDREVRLNDPSKSNLPFGYTRSYVDVFTSTLSERPIIYNVTALDEKGLENKEDIATFLSTLSDLNGFSRESKKILAEGLKTGTFAVRVNYRPPAEPITYMYLYNNKPIEDTYTPDIGDVPYVEHVDVFKIFPDQGTGNLSHITERDVVPIDTALQMFSGLINHKSNTSPLKDQDFIKNLVLNTNGADKTDYGSVRNEVHSEINQQLREKDTTYTTTSTTSTTYNRVDEDIRTTQNRVEYKYYVTKTRIVLFINNYPVYIGPNIYGFIPYIIKPTSNADIRLGVEGIPFLLRGVELGINGYMNAYLDNVNMLNQPNFAARKGSVIDEQAFRNMKPGEIIYTEGNPGDAIRPLDKGTISDFNILEIFGQNAQQLTGASEYNLGISARERTATGANATAQASQKRLTPFIESFMVVMSESGKMLTRMATKFWVTPRKLIVSTENNKEIIKKFQSKKLAGLVNVTLELDSMFAAQNELQNKRLIEILNLVKGTGLVKEDELMRQIIQNTGLPTSKIIPETAPEVTNPDEAALPPLDLAEPTPNNAELPTELRELVTPQLNLQAPSNTI